MLLVCCGGADDYDSPEQQAEDLAFRLADAEIGPDEGMDIGELDQAITFESGGYGVMKNTIGTKCGTPFGGWPNKCQVPKEKTVNFRWTFGALTEGGVDWVAAFNTAGSYVCAVLNARGWSCTKALASGTQRERVQPWDLDQTALGMCQYTNLSNGPLYTLPSGQVMGNYEYQDGCQIYVDTTYLAALTVGMSATSKRREAENLIIHEMGHCIGLPHQEPPFVLENVMAPKQLNGYPEIIANHEKDWLLRYVPGVLHP